MIKLNTKIHRDIMLLIKSPKEYLYSFSYSNVNKKTIKPFNQKCYQTGYNLTRIIRKKLSSCKVHFVGSTSLKIPGSGDIDILIESPSKEFKKYLSKLITLFGKPKKSRVFFHEWKFYKNKYLVELSLIDPNCHEFKVRMKIYNTLKNDRIKLALYKKLLTNLNGETEREYDRNRQIFFNELLNR
jgi:hypothetical protein